MLRHSKRQYHASLLNKYIFDTNETWIILNTCINGKNKQEHFLSESFSCVGRTYSSIQLLMDLMTFKCQFKIIAPNTQI